ncbi:MAG: YvrJ family protein [Amphibacillus sp.]|nr:YvrJ family protein [Amphibacillus sp.]
MNEHWLSIITEVGFPIAVTFYLLHRIETKLNTLIEAITILPEKLLIDSADKR